MGVISVLVPSHRATNFLSASRKGKTTFWLISGDAFLGNFDFKIATAASRAGTIKLPNNSASRAVNSKL